MDPSERAKQRSDDARGASEAAVRRSNDAIAEARRRMHLVREHNEAVLAKLARRAAPTR
jgi:hypothetical protein